MAPGESRHVDLLGKYRYVLRRMGEAGWQPVPHARATGLLIERYGDCGGKMLWAVRNAGKQTVQSRLTLTLAKLGLGSGKGKPLTLRSLLDDLPCPCRVKDGLLSAMLRMEGRRTLVLELV